MWCRFLYDTRGSCTHRTRLRCRRPLLTPQQLSEDGCADVLIMTLHACKLFYECPTNRRCLPYACTIHKWTNPTTNDEIIAFRVHEMYGIKALIYVKEMTEEGPPPIAATPARRSVNATFCGFPTMKINDVLCRLLTARHLSLLTAKQTVRNGDVKKNGSKQANERKKGLLPRQSWSFLGQFDR